MLPSEAAFNFCLVAGEDERCKKKMGANYGTYLTETFDKLILVIVERVIINMGLTRCSETSALVFCAFDHTYGRVPLDGSIFII